MVVESDTVAISMGSMLNDEQEKNILRRAERGDAEAAFRLQAHFNSKKDYMKARYWQLRAALSGYPIAQYSQWFALRESDDCADMGEALAWLESSARAGDVEAKNTLSEYAGRTANCVP